MKNIFLIERDTNILHGLLARFSASGAQVTTDDCTEDRVITKKRIKEGNFDCIVIGIDFSIEDNVDFLEDLKEDEDIVHIPMFVFSHSDDQNVFAVCDRLGIEHCFMARDFELDGFVSRVIKIINNKYSKIKTKK